MKLSIQENLLPGDNFLEKARKAKEYGFDAIELWGNNLEERKEEIKQSLSETDIEISTICSGYKGSLLSGKKEERDIAVNDIVNLIRIGAELRAVGLIVVPIFGPSQIPDLSPWKSVKEIEENLICELLKEIGKESEKTNCFCLLEPLNRYETHFMNTVKHAKSIIKKVNSSGIKIMADFFHMNIEERKISEAIREGGNFICHVHLADSNRFLPGQGHIDFPEGFTALKGIHYNGYMALECAISGEAEEELPKCVKYLRSIWSKAGNQ